MNSSEARRQLDTAIRERGRLRKSAEYFGWTGHASNRYGDAARAVWRARWALALAWLFGRRVQSVQATRATRRPARGTNDENHDAA